FWRTNVNDQGGDAGRKGRVVRAVAGKAPMHGRGRVGRRIEIVAERRAKRGLVAAVDLHILYNGGKRASGAAGLQHAADGAGLRLDAGKPGAGGVDRAADSGFVEAG